MATKIEKLVAQYESALEAYELDRSEANLKVRNDLAQKLSVQITGIRSNRGGSGITVEEN